MKPISRLAHLLWPCVSIAFAACLVEAWHLITNARLVSPVFLPGPDKALAALWRGWMSGDLASHTGSTVLRMLEGWVLASAVGISLGAVIGTSKMARIYLGPTLETLRPLPASALIPVFIAVFGLSEAMILGVIGFGALWPMLLATIHGVSSVDPVLYEVAAALRMNRLALIFKIALPNAMPDILAALRLGITIALILAVVGEMLTGQRGLGQWLLLAARSFRSADLFAGVIVLGGIGIVTSKGIALLERGLLRWKAPG